MSRLLFAPLAEQDLHDILEYIAKDDPAAAVGFVRELRDKCQLLAEHPHLGRPRPVFRSGTFRSFPVGSYVIFYRPVGEGIEVARVVHGARDLDALL